MEKFQTPKEAIRAREQCRASCLPRINCAALDRLSLLSHRAVLACDREAAFIEAQGAIVKAQISGAIQSRRISNPG
jgi:hypothetical protein